MGAQSAPYEGCPFSPPHSESSADPNHDFLFSWHRRVGVPEWSPHADFLHAPRQLRRRARVLPIMRPSGVHACWYTLRAAGGISRDERLHSASPLLWRAETIRLWSLGDVRRGNTRSVRWHGFRAVPISTLFSGGL